MKTPQILLALASAAVAAMLGACSAALPSPEIHAMTETTAPSAKPQPDTATYCLGRFLIDVPRGSKLVGGNYKYDFARIEEATQVSREQFGREVEAREEKLRSTKHKKEPSLLQVAQQPAPNSRVLAFFEEPYITAGINIEGYKWVDGWRYLIKDEVDDDRQAFGLNRMREILSRLRPRPDTEIPKDPGYCFEGGFIANNEWENEEAAMDFRIPEHPDVIVSIELFPLAAHKRDKPLLDRMGGVMQQLGTLATGVQVLRKGERRAGPFKGQEYLTAVPSSGGMRGHLFKWETQGGGTLEEPHMTIELSTGEASKKGNPQQTRLSDEQALKLWDRIVSSFRLRPVGSAPVKTSEASQPKTPLGELVATGRACPQSGWWECAEEARPVQGGRRQFFRAGDQMPQAVLQGEPSVWQKLKGDVPTHRLATVWKLADYETPPAPRAAQVTTAAPNAAPNGEDKQP